jgi:hypothetical protein
LERYIFYTSQYAKGKGIVLDVHQEFARLEQQKSKEEILKLLLGKGGFSLTP